MSMASEKPKATRQAFGEILAELGQTHPEIVVLDADLAKSTKSELFGKRFPDRFFEMGIAEANMIGTGAGLALCGHTAFVCSFGCFVTGRYDQIRMSIAYAQANVCVVGTHAGIGIGDDGHSQMGLEDLAIMRGLPKMQVFQPCDERETKQIVQHIVEKKGPAYLRLTRQALSSCHDSSYHFTPGKLNILSQSDAEIALFATGATVQEVLLASQKLHQKGIKSTVVNVPTIKPFDSVGVIELAKKHKLFVSVEDHYVIGGLGTCVAEALSDSDLDRKPKLVRLGVQDVFGESGDPAELYEKFGISANQIFKTVLQHYV